MTHNKDLHILQIVEPGLDGVFRHVEGLIHYLISQKQYVSLAYSSKRSSDRLFELINTVKQSGGYTFDLNTGNAPGFNDISAFTQIYKICQKNTVSVIHSHSSKAGVLGRVAAKQLKLPSFYTPNAYYGMGFRTGFLTPTYNFIEKVMGSIGYTINVSQEEIDFGQQKLRISSKSQYLIHNAVDFDSFAPSDNFEAKSTIRKKYNIAPNAILLGSAGRLSYQKDPQTLYRAFSKILDTHKNLYLVHLGKGEFEDELQTLIKTLKLEERIIRIEYLAEPLEFYQMIDGFILTSRYEGLAFSILEALACNLPLILSDAPGNRSFEQLDFTELWYGKPEDANDFANKITDFINYLNSNKPCTNREIAETHFSIENCYGKILRLYQNS